MRKKKFLQTAAIISAVACIFGSSAIPANATDEETTIAQQLRNEGINDFTREELRDFVDYLNSDVPDTQNESIDFTSQEEIDHLATLAQYSTRTTSPITVKDNRVGELWEVRGRDAYRTCSAGYIGKGFWLTAEHCVHNNEGMTGFIEQPDGEFAGIEGIWINGKNKDVALVKVGSGISAQPFSVAAAKPEVGHKISLIGYGGRPAFNPSQIDGIVLDNDVSVDYRNVNIHYDDLSSAYPTGEYKTVGGDSGAPVWLGNTLLGVNSGGDRYGKTFYFANINEHKTWIENFSNSYWGPSIGNRWRAFRGGLGAALKRIDGNYSFGSADLSS